MTKILLVSEDYIKTNSTLGDNVFGKYMLPAIREAQDIHLQSILGSCLYNRILSMVNDGSIVAAENEAYKTLLDDHIQPYLLYQVQTDVIPYINIKLGNIGSVVASDEYIQTLSQGNVDLVQHNLQNKADFYARRMQEFILEHCKDYTEMDECACKKMKANLKSAASTDWFLGGTRGKKVK